MTLPQVEATSRAGAGTAAAGEAGSTQPLPWSAATGRLAEGGWSRLATVCPDGAPHVVPVLAAWSEPVPYVASKDSARKSRKLGSDPRCALSTGTGDLHLVIEGRARRVRRAGLARASAAFEAIHGWPTEVAGDLLDAECGAPTSGGPPYAVFADHADEGVRLPDRRRDRDPTRWRFDP